jgi:hypothetical protein
MAAPRSPNYPQAGLGEAIEKVRKIWKADGGNFVAPEAVAKHLGYTSMNGAAQVTLSALKKYGLVEVGQQGKMRVSGTAVTILEGLGTPDYCEALVEAAFGPALFKELRSEFPSGIPSSDAVRFHLIKHGGFNADAATKAAKAFRETLELVTAEVGEYTVPTVVEAPQANPGESMQEVFSGAEALEAPSPVTAAQPRAVPSAPAPAASGSGLLLQVPFRGTTLTVRIDAGGQTLTKEHVARVCAYLKLTEDDLGGPEADE